MKIAKSVGYLKYTFSFFVLRYLTATKNCQQKQQQQQQQQHQHPQSVSA